MSILSSLLLGTLQGVTEFLPVSSSGHLAIVQSFIPGFSQPGVLFDVTLHFGTLLAVVVFFWKKIWKLNFRYIGFLALATLPAVVIGFVFKKPLENLFFNVRLIGFALLATGIINYLTYRSASGKKEVNFKNSIFVGLAQAIAIIPGISRSGSTIFAGVKQGIKPKEAAEFSFLLSVPAVLGANALEIVSNYTAQINIGNYLIGFMAAFIAGYFSISLVLRFLQEKKFKYFAFYCLIAGALAILL